jgi:AraC-like DNA-binding protein
MWEWDVPESSLARGITGKLLPSVAPQLAIHFRDAMWSDRLKGGSIYRQIACGIQTQVVTVRATGQVGAIMVRLKPEGAARLLGPTLRELRDSQADISDLFPKSDIASLVDALACAVTTAQRAQLVETFLLKHRVRGLNEAVLYAAALQRRNTSILPVSELASRVNMSERQFSRQFSDTFGLAPKKFSRLLRLTRVLDLYQRHWTWTAIAHECGFADQAHLIHDFRDLVNQAPEEFVTAAFAQGVRDVNYTLGSGTLSNTFIL